MNTWFNIQQNGVNAEIYIYDEIGAWGVSAKDFVADLNALKDVSNLDLHINSPGGSVMDVLAMMQALNRSKANIVAYIDGIAASAASRLIMAADSIVMAENGFLMIHNTWTVTAGNADELRKEADLLDKFDDGLANDYAKKSGMEVEVIKKFLADDTWFTAQEALDAQLIDSIGAEQKAAACVSENFVKRIGRLTNRPTNLNFEIEKEKQQEPEKEPEQIDPEKIYQKELDRRFGPMAIEMNINT